MSKYESYDRKLLSLIGEGKSQFAVLVPLMTDEHEKIYGLAGVPFRVVDARLQSLRERGLICYRAGKWQVGQ